MQGSRAIYVETHVHTDMDRLWELTQVPGQHTRWDLRFTHIDYLPRPDQDEPQHFRYAVRLAPGVAVAGVGTTLGEVSRADGSRTSALGFGSDSPLSPIRVGRGYWRYVPTQDGVRFLTGYDYEPRWGVFGAMVDRAAFRPAMGWATAWSFDRLRLWLETGQTPERSRLMALADGAMRIAGVLTGAALVRRAGGPVPTAGLAGVVLAVAASRIPALPGVPVARRCPRRPPDRLGETPPTTMERVNQR
ncbi:hypothetical protein BH24ACT8_BH24ACT8_07780 [soil metagenome]